jgi:hypothetical protein
VSDDESLRGSSEEISRLLLKLSAKVRAAFISELKKELPRYAIAEDYVLKAGPVSRPRGELFSKGRPKLTSAEDPEKAAYDKVLERVLAKFEKDLYAVR